MENIYNYLYTNDLFNILIKEQAQAKEYEKKEENSKDNSDSEKKDNNSSDNEDNEDNEKKQNSSYFEKFMDLLLKDYITFYLLQNNHEKNENEENYNPYDVEHDLILLLIKKRFKKDSNILKLNKNDDLKLFLFKILWLEANSKKSLFKDILEYIEKGNANYITQEKRNPQHTEEINECFYMLLASICQCITNEKIFKKLDSYDEFKLYINKCKNALQIISRLSDDLLLYLNEKYIIEEFLLIINYPYNHPIDKDFSKDILKKLKDLSSIMQIESENKITKLNLSFIDLNNYLIKKFNNNKENNVNEDKNDNKYYELLSSFYLKETI